MRVVGVQRIVVRKELYDYLKGVKEELLTFSEEKVKHFHARIN